MSKKTRIENLFVQIYFLTSNIFINIQKHIQYIFMIKTDNAEKQNRKTKYYNYK